MDPAFGILIILVSFIFLTILKIFDTVSIMRKQGKAQILTKLDHLIVDEKLDLMLKPEISQVEEKKPIPEQPVELANISVKSSVTFRQQHIREIPVENISFTDPFSVILSDLKNNPDVQEFQLFTNSQHIFSGALNDTFSRKVDRILNDLEACKYKVFPFYKIEDSRIIRLYLETQNNFVIEELFELWRMGYSHPVLPELFIHYFFAIGSPQAELILKSILVHNILDEKELRRICFLYQDLLGPKIVFSDIQEEIPSKIQDAFDMSSIFMFKKIFVTRQMWKNWEDFIFLDLPENRKAEFYLFYFKFLEKQTSLLLYYMLLNQFKPMFSDQWREFVERQAFFYGHYDKLNRLAFIPPEYSPLITKNGSEFSESMEESILSLKDKPFFHFHKFLIYDIHHSPEINTFKIPEHLLDEVMNNLAVLPGEKNYIPQAIRFVLFLYYYNQRNIEKVNLIMPFIHGRIGKFIPKLYQVRLLFKKQQYEKAWHEIMDLWNNDEQNMLLMNEAAIYAYHAGQIKEAEDLFSRLRKIYPDNPAILHNESVFLQHKARLLRENREFYIAPVSRESIGKLKMRLEAEENSPSEKEFSFAQNTN